MSTAQSPAPAPVAENGATASIGPASKSVATSGATSEPAAVQAAVPTAEPKPELSFGGRGRRLLLGLVVLFLGGSGLVYEYCLSTLATHLLGNSVEQFSLIIALMLFAMGLAGLAQRGLRDPERVAETFVLVETLLGLVGGASAIVLYLAFAYLSHFHLALYTLALGIGFGIGMEIPLLLRINQAWRGSLKDNVGEVFALDYIGALLGALVWAWLLLPRFALDRISLFLGLANMAVAAVTLIAFWHLIRRRVLVVGVLVASCASLAALTWAGPELVVEARQRLYTHPIRLHTASAYQDIVMTGRGARIGMYLNGHLQFDSEDEYIYHELLVHPAMMAVGRPVRSALVLGGGDGLAVREILKWPAVTRVVLVDLDPAVTELARTWPPLVALNGGALLDARVDLKPSPAVRPGDTVTVTQAAQQPADAVQGEVVPVAEVHLFHLDADQYVRHLDETFDVVVADFPDPSAPDLAKLFSLEFYQQVRRCLAEDGVLVVQASSPYATRHAFWAVRDTLAAAGFETRAMHAHVPTFGEWGWILARVGSMPAPAGDPPVSTRYLDGPVLAAAQVFPRPMGAPLGEPAVSTRLDPQVMRLYQRGEELRGRVWFP